MPVDRRYDAENIAFHLGKNVVSHSDRLFLAEQMIVRDHCLKVNRSESFLTQRLSSGVPSTKMSSSIPSSSPKSKTASTRARHRKTSPRRSSQLFPTEPFSKMRHQRQKRQENERKNFRDYSPPSLYWHHNKTKESHRDNIQRTHS